VLVLFYVIAVGTPYYFSPELCNGDKYTDKWDIWAIGWILYEMWSLRRPFEGEDYEELKGNILNRTMDLIPNIYSKDLHELVTEMLWKDLEKRPSTNDIIQSEKFIKNCLDRNIIPPLDIKQTQSLTLPSEQLKTPHITLAWQTKFTPDVNEYKESTFTPYANRLDKQLDERSSLSRLLTPVRKLVTKRRTQNFFTFSKKNFKCKTSSKHYLSFIY
jgi:serine/threonine protein kinase